MSSVNPQNCEARERLENLVQHHLHELGQLVSLEADVIKSGDAKRILEIDQNIETSFGAKERAMGALNEHRSTHGC